MRFTLTPATALKSRFLCFCRSCRSHFQLEKSLSWLWWEWRTGNTFPPSLTRWSHQSRRSCLMLLSNNKQSTFPTRLYHTVHITQTKTTDIFSKIFLKAHKNSPQETITSVSSVTAPLRLCTIEITGTVVSFSYLWKHNSHTSRPQYRGALYQQYKKRCSKLTIANVQYSIFFLINLWKQLEKKFGLVKIIILPYFNLFFLSVKFLAAEIDFDLFL